MWFLLLMLAPFSAFAQGDLPFHTGAVKPLTAAEQQLESEYLERAKREEWTFDFDVRNVGRFNIQGLKEGAAPLFSTGQSSMSIGDEDAELMPLKLADFGIELPPIKDQSTCGSCVYFAVTWAFEALNWLRGHLTPILSPRHLMNCSNEGMQCNGAWASGVSEGLIRLGGLVEESAYPYRPVSGRCQVPQDEPLHGHIESAEVIASTPRNVLAALHQRLPVLATIGANGSFMSFKGGVYNACSQTPTNHQMVIDEVDCETAVNADGTCKFDANGNLPPGVGSYGGPNSWGLDFGDRGRFKIKITDRNGKKCNRIAEETMVLHSGLPLPPVGPVEFELRNGPYPVKVTVQPGGPYEADKLKANLIALGF